MPLEVDTDGAVRYASWTVFGVSSSSDDSKWGCRVYSDLTSRLPIDRSTPPPVNLRSVSSPGGRDEALAAARPRLAAQRAHHGSHGAG